MTAQNLYVAGAEPRSGKSVVALGLMEMLSTRSNALGFFRPVIRAREQDPIIELMRGRYSLTASYEAMYGLDYRSAREMLAGGRYDAVLKSILEKYRTLQAECEHVVCLGTDYSGVEAPLEFDFNADVANNLGCHVVPVVKGLGREPEQALDATTAFLHLLHERGCDVLATVVNRVDAGRVERVRAILEDRLDTMRPWYVLAENPALGRPSVADVARALGADCLYGTPESLSREVRGYKVAAMLLPDFLNHVEGESLIITAGDRADIILGSLMAHPSRAYPQIAGLLLSGGLQPAPEVMRLIGGLGSVPVAVLSVTTDTFTTALNASAVDATLDAANERRIATALGTIEGSIDAGELLAHISTTASSRVTPLMFEYELIRKARARRRHMVLPEGTEPRILQAAEILTLRDVVQVTLLGPPETVRARIEELGLHLDEVDIIDPQTSSHRQRFAQTYYELRRHKGISKEMAYDLMADVSYFGTMMVHHDLADGMISGSVNTTQHTLRPALEIIKTRPGSRIVSSVFFMCLADRVLVFGDCAVNPNPDAENLAAIAIDSALTAERFGIVPRIAMLSYSTGESGRGESVDKVRRATALVREMRPDLRIAGPIQYDAAIDASVARAKMPGDEVAGNATVFIFPDLNTGNNTYKAVQRAAHALAIGPVLQGLDRPVNDLSRGCTVPDIVNTVAITAIQAQDDRPSPLPRPGTSL